MYLLSGVSSGGRRQRFGYRYEAQAVALSIVRKKKRKKSEDQEILYVSNMLFMY